MRTKYEEVGVDPRKNGISVFKSATESLFPLSFCIVGRDPYLKGHGLVLHTDGAGSKPIQSYLQWKETGDISWFQGLARDVIAMNLDDLICVGADPIGFVDYVALNKEVLPKGKVLTSLNSGFKKVFDLLEGYGINISFLGGETADLPDQLKTLDVSGTIYGRVKLSDATTGEDIRSGDVIVGLKSGGRTKYEEEKNSGIMCNGIALARHSLMNEKYERKYPEIRGPGKYYGRFAHVDYNEDIEMAIGEAIASPTRIFAPVLAEILGKYRDHVKGMVHNTGGGQTKCLALGKDVHYIKDDLIYPDPVFHLIQRESGEKWRAMFEEFNMGVGFEIIVEKDYAEDILGVAKKFDIGAKVIGRCEEGEGGNKVTIHSEFGDFTYG